VACQRAQKKPTRDGPTVSTSNATDPRTGFAPRSDDRECEPELGLEFILPLAHHRRGRAHYDKIDTAPEDELTQYQTGFDGLAGADIVRDQQIGAR
jgi:hypothetical protein